MEKNKKKDKPSKTNTQLVEQKPDESNKASKPNDSKDAREEKELMKNSK